MTIFSKIFRSKNVVRNVSYGDDPKMTYDEYPSVKKSDPVVIFWHGGSWQRGSKSGYGYVGVYLQKIGCHGVVADYPKYPTQTFPGFIKDAQILLNEIRLKYPKSPVYLAGHSCGGHTALIVAMKQRENPVTGVISLAAPNWFSRRNWPRWQKIFTESYESKKQETYSYVENAPKNTKFLLVHGTNDVTVSPKGTARLHELLMTSNINSMYKTLQGVNHYLILGVFVPGMFKGTKQTIKNFIGV